MRKFTATTVLSVIFSLALLASCALGQSPKYIIMFLGDGMGPNHRILAEQVSKVTDRGELEMNHLPVQGESKTNSLSGVTDSAASSTAFACGAKTNNGMLGMTPDETIVESVVVDAQKAGWKTGIITTDKLNGATPSGYYAHVKSRNMYDEILNQAAKSGIDFFGGPGFNSQNDVDKTLLKGGYNVVKGKIDPANPPKLPCANLKISSLADATGSALALLENPKGFFIMIESSSIDGYSHGNHFPGAIGETIAMNDAVRVALDFYKKHPDDTLIITTADHECGGLTIVNKDLDPKGLLNVRDPGTVEKIVVTDIVSLKPAPKEFVVNVAEAMGLKNISDKDRQLLMDLYSQSKITGDGGAVNEVKRLMYEQAGVKWTSGGHTGVNVPTTAIGPGSEAFKGEYENTHIADAIRGFITKPAEKKSAE
jgi:alkaline phosphatase